ncbi:MAG: hypothetical protein P8100_12610 [bacterium]|jgi:hypothetical protein
MSPVIRNILAVILGIVLGGALNMGIITISDFIIPLPEGVDATSMESLINSMHLYEPKHFIMPFLAHALGTLVGAFIAALIAASRKMTIALIIGAFFLLGGILNILMLPSPVWFTLLDLIVAYFPMAWLGGLLGITVYRKPPGFE